MKISVLFIGMSMMSMMIFGMIWALLNQYHAGCFDWYKPFSAYERMQIVGPAYIPIITGLIIYCFATYKK